MHRGSTHILRKAFGDKIEESTLDTLRKAADLNAYPNGHIFCRQGEPGDSFFIIVEGHCAATKTSEDGQEHLLSVLHPGDYFGEMALIDNSPRMATVTAATPAKVLEFSEVVFDRLIVESPVVANSFLRRVMGDMRSQDRRAIEELKRKNEELENAYQDLKAAQSELVEKERLEHEMELAADAQRNLLPRQLPVYKNYHFAAYQSPARLVGGDFYDVINLDDEHIGILLADVADKGLHAALFMAVTRTLFRREAMQFLSPSSVALAVHQGMLEIAPDHDSFITAFYGVLHQPSGRLTYIRAAQERPLLIRQDKDITQLPGDGRFLGMLPGLTLQEYSVLLQPGDRLLIFSDGVPDAVNWQDNAFGNDRLIRTIRRTSYQNAKELVDHITKEIALWSEGAASFDDLTLLALEVTNE